MKIICQVKQFHALIQETPEIEGQVKLQRAGSYITSRAHVNATEKINTLQNPHNFESPTCASGLFKRGAAGNNEMWGVMAAEGGACQPSCPVRPICIIGHFRFQVPFYFLAGRFKGQNTHAAEQIGVAGTLHCFWFMRTTYPREENKWKVVRRIKSRDTLRFSHVIVLFLQCRPHKHRQ